MVSWGRWWRWRRGQGKGAAKTARIIMVMIIVMIIVTLDHVIVIVIVKNAKIILVVVIIVLVVIMDHVIVMYFGQPEGSMVIVCAQRGKVGSMLWWARAIEVHLDYCGINTLNSI